MACNVFSFFGIGRPSSKLGGAAKLPPRLLRELQHLDSAVSIDEHGREQESDYGS